jgi:K+-sensing histidine kinase KdpD
MIALAIYATILGLCFSIHPVESEAYLYHLFFLSSYVATIFLGGGPGFLIILLGLISCNYYFIEPYGHFTSLSNADIFYLANYTFGAVLVIVTIEYLQRNVYENKLLLRASESRYKMFLHRENQRILLTRHLDKMH